jgi:hypothetical protein
MDPQPSHNTHLTIKLTCIVSDKCFLVLIHTPLFMFVGPLALLISNKFTCFYCCVINRSLHQILTKGAKVDLKPSEEVDPCKCVRTHSRSHAGAAIERRPSQPASHAQTLAALEVICGRNISF